MDIRHKEHTIQRLGRVNIYRPETKTSKGLLNGKPFYVDAKLRTLPEGTAQVAPEFDTQIVWDKSFYLTWVVTGYFEEITITIKQGSTLVAELITQETEATFEGDDFGFVNDTEYTVEIEGDGLFGTSISVTPSSKVPQNLTQDAITSTTLDFSWDEVTGDVRDYTVQVTNEDTAEVEQTITGITGMSTTIYGLTEEANYSVQVKAVSEQGLFESDWSSKLEFVPTDKPDAPEGFDITIDTIAEKTIDVLEDTWVAEPQPSEIKYNTDPERLLANEASNNDREIFIKIDLRDYATPFSLVEIEFTMVSNQGGSNTLHLVKTTGISWSQETLTWNNRPASVGSTYSKTVLSELAGESFKVDITGLVNSNLGDIIGIRGYAISEDNIRMASTRNSTYAGPNVVSPDFQDEQKNAVCTWDAVTGVDGYNVYLSDDGGSTYTKQNTSLVTGLTYTIEALEDGNYQAYVTSEKNGLESDPSNVESFNISPPTSNGIISTTGTTTKTGSWSWATGREFQVSANTRCTALRARSADNRTSDVIITIYEKSTENVVAQETIPIGVEPQDVWVEVAINPVNLNVGTDYVIAHRPTSSARNVHINDVVDVEFGGVYVPVSGRQYVFDTGTGMPTNVSSASKCQTSCDLVMETL